MTPDELAALPELPAAPEKGPIPTGKEGKHFWPSRSRARTSTAPGCRTD